ncbi:MAG: hypothetical protein JWO18_1396 [Microbacteriaceae bacterium]|nr:hypothetical protein [Microbacteriaceae bacterium]
MWCVTAQGESGSGVSRLSGVSLILAATIMSGIASYVVTWLVPHQIGFAAYATFAVFWSFIYLVVGALFGIQQEVTRATSATAGAADAHVGKARNFGLAGGVVVFLLVVATAPLWVSAAFPVGGWSYVWPLAIGTASFVMIAVLCGSLYGIARWRELAMLMVTDSLLRLIGIAIVLGFTSSTVALAWVVAIPFPLTLVLLWPFIRRSIVGKTELDVGYRSITWNVSRTILAAASTGVMVSGFPLLLGLTSSGVSKVTFGFVILATTLTRAPLIVIAMSLQSYFIIIFRDRADRFWRTFLRLQGLILASGVVLAALGWLLGPSVFGILFPAGPRPEGWFIAALVLSSALVGSLCISAPAVLARSAHFVYSAGWVVGALVTIASLLLPVDFTTRVVIALFAGPIAGLFLHGGYLLTRGRVSAVTVAGP